jgi:D-tyrosyl-tRNA(Tyr) deacylase
MKALIQRVSEARVTVGNRTAGKIGKGLLIFLGVEKGDSVNDRAFICRKISQLRIFEDAAGKMNLSVRDIQGELLVVSQFTLIADCRKGNRPSFAGAEEPSVAEDTYLRLIETLKQEGLKVSSGVFAAHMSVQLKNDGPVTMLLDSRQ